jgi:hypothetical protein
MLLVDYTDMKIGINNLKDLIEVVAWLVGAGSLAFTAYTYYLNKKQFNFAVIISCTERFQKIMAQLKSANEEERKRAVKQYVDLCHEELFYFRHDYLPDEIIDEWIDGMIYYLPYFVNGENKNQGSDYLKEIEESELLEEYPKLREAFSVEDIYDLTDKNQREKLVRAIKGNLK